MARPATRVLGRLQGIVGVRAESQTWAPLEAAIWDYLSHPDV